jgi:hypothetical protein
MIQKSKNIFKYLIIALFLINCFGYITHTDQKKYKKINYNDSHRRHSALKVVFGG